MELIVVKIWVVELIAADKFIIEGMVVFICDENITNMGIIVL